MQWIAYLMTFLFVGFTTPAQALSEAPVRVRIKSVSSKVTLSGLNIRFVGLEAKIRPVAISQTRNVSIARVNIADKNYWQISQNQNMESGHIVSAQEELTVQGEGLRQGVTELPNKIILRENAAGDIDVIGSVPLEDYVQAVLMNEMPLSWPEETLKAQAVAIRSYTKAVLRERANKDYHVESSVLDQVYKKIDAGIRPELLQKARAAVEATEGVTLINLKGRPLKAFYHADCGGKTVLASSVWKQEKDSDMGTAVDSACEYNPRTQWSLTLTKEKFQRLLRSFVGELRSNEFRKLVGFMDLKSTKFEVYDKGLNVEFKGQGFGHGVGMCQWGSKALGQRGFSYQRILKHYYPLASLQITQN